MKTISRWAKHHVVTAVTIIVLLKIALAYMAVALGLFLVETGFIISGWWLFIFAAIYLYCCVTYPNKFQAPDASYNLRKLRDFVIGICTFCAIVGVTNNINNTTPHYISSAKASSIIPLSTAVKSSSVLTEIHGKNIAGERKILRRTQRLQLKNYIKATFSNDGKTKLKVWQILIISILVTGMLMGTAVLSCNLSCSGAEGAAGAVLLLGLTLSVFGALALAKWMRRGTHTSEESPAVE